MATTKHKKGKKHKSKHDNAGEGMAPGTEAAHPETDQPRMSAKEFNKALKPLQVELVKLQEWVKATGAKVCIVFEGRDAAGKGGTIKRITEQRQPARLPRRRPARTDRAGEVADVHSALRAAPARRRRGRHLRPQLVQPRRRRACDGLLHRRAGRRLPAARRPQFERCIDRMPASS